MTENFHTLRNGNKIPILGFGTYRMPSGIQTEEAVIQAIKTGYRHIDCASVYGNEKSVGNALRKSGLAREELFITSKLWNEHKGSHRTVAAFQRTLRDLQLDYLDLYLIHWPIAKASRNRWQAINTECWKIFEELYSKGKIKAIGVSNFLPHHFEPLLSTAEIQPMVNQIELHPGMLQPETVSFCKQYNIIVEAWAPFSNGQLLQHPILNDIAAKYQKSVAQLCLRWLIQKGYVPLAKSVTAARIQENINIFDFDLNRQDCERIDKITNCANSGLHPDRTIF